MHEQRGICGRPTKLVRKMSARGVSQIWILEERVGLVPFPPPFRIIGGHLFQTDTQHTILIEQTNKKGKRRKFAKVVGEREVAGSNPGRAHKRS
jgi:hypothetical protein